MSPFNIIILIKDNAVKKILYLFYIFEYNIIYGGCDGRDCI